MTFPASAWRPGTSAPSFTCMMTTIFERSHPIVHGPRDVPVAPIDALADARSLARGDHRCPFAERDVRFPPRTRMILRPLAFALHAIELRE